MPASLAAVGGHKNFTGGPAIEASVTKVTKQ